MPTALRIITTALTDLGILPMGEAVPMHLSDEGREELNALLASWSVEGLLIPIHTQDILTLTLGQASYTIGKTTPASNFDTEVPIKLISAFIRDNSIDTPLEIFNNLLEYNTYAKKTTKGIPGGAFFDTVGRIYFYPVPDKTYTNGLYLTSEKYLKSFTTLSATNLPPEYESALATNLAVRLMPKFGKRDDILIGQARLFKNSLLTNNSRLYVKEASFDFAITRGVLR